MTLDILDPNATEESAQRSLRMSNAQRKADPKRRENNDEGELFQPTNVNNKFAWQSHVLHRNEDDEKREGGTHFPEAQPVKPETHSNNANDAVDDEQLQPQANGHTAMSDGQATDLNENVQPQRVNASGQAVPQSQEDTPTWRRRFSLIPSRTFAGPESSARWKDWKQALKFGKSRGVSNPGKVQAQKRPDLDESDEAARMRASNLVTSLLAGSPAALFLASNFLKDDHGTRRAPLLLSQIGIDIEDVSKPGNKHVKFRINLEYGVGPSRLRWHVIKDLRDFVGLHSRLKVSVFQSKGFRGKKNVDLPKFPRISNKDDEETGDSHEPPTFNEAYLSVPEADHLNDTGHRRSHSSDGIRSLSSISNHSEHSGLLGRIHRMTSRISLGDSNDNMNDTQEHKAQFRKKLETYLKQLFVVLCLKPDANRLFQFFELSPLGVLLSYENGLQGKQGYMIVGSSSKAQGWRVGHLKFSDFKQMVVRHTNKWFLVRDSYIMYVSDIYSTTPLEVFMVDNQFKMTYSGEDTSAGPIQFDNDNESFYDDVLSMDDDIALRGSRNSIPHLVIKLENGERELRMIAKSKNQALMWAQSIQFMQMNSVWSKSNRFGSFAPVRENSFAQWFVDARDHFWAVSSAMEMAKDVIYIHDWWLSPELYMRRPANGNQEWRLDRLLKRKAEQGVKVFVIIYRNVASTVITDSLWSKHSLIDLHPNVHVLRSPNQWLQNTYFWAHHEKLCIIDHTIAFVGGIDLCFGRYDTPDHVLADDSPRDFGTRKDATEESVQFQTFPGKDYSNPRVKDFDRLDKPYESMYDRSVVPRMPWHDVHMMTAGQPARDLARHFVQRWNYLLRQKRPSRPTPILTPPSDFTPEELEEFDFNGTCEVQLLRSSGNWSLGLKKHEQSIQNAYLKLIETSEHFVYIENQFFITASAFDGTVIENRIGDALVDRIIRAHNEKKKWKAMIVIPLMPGFESQVDEAEGSSVRVIMQCQYQSISRGTTSIFAKLKKMKINPYDYIQFYSLRKWGRIGPNRTVVSEQLYIHAKIMIVDDRTALIGSANINERSQRGNRDSEVAAVVRDTDLVNTTMDCKPFKAGKFAHTLRMRLMREHLGIDVDILDLVERRFNKIEELARETHTGKNSKTHNFSDDDAAARSSMVELASRDVLNMPSGTERWKQFQRSQNIPTNDTLPTSDPMFDKINQNDDKHNLPDHLKAKSHKPLSLIYHSFNNRAREENMGIRDQKQFSSDSRIENNEQHKRDVEGNGADRMGAKEYKGFKLNAARTLKKWALESLANESTHVFLPNVEQVLEFLDDDDLIKNPSILTNDEEMALNDRNEERWEMLKRIAYLQRVAAKQRDQINEENLKRSKVGISPLQPSVDNKSDNATATLGSSNEHCSSPSEFPGSSTNQSSPETEMKEIEELPGENIPVSNLDHAGIRHIVEHFNETGSGTKFNKFIDPYGFGDPLDDAFYEDVWFDNANRNTEIFREVFHCQPDDTVGTWEDYKDFSKLSTAFALAQEQEREARELLKRYSHDPDSSEDEIGSHCRDSIRLKDIDDVNPVEGILGNAPPEHLSDDFLPDSDGPKRGRSGEYGFRKRSPLGQERVFDRETADRIMSEVQGHLIIFPTDWLWKEIEGGNWFYNMDRLPPIEIYD